MMRKSKVETFSLLGGALWNVSARSSGGNLEERRRLPRLCAERLGGHIYVFKNASSAHP